MNSLYSRIDYFGNVINPYQFPMFKIGDKIQIDLDKPKHDYYQDYYSNPYNIYNVHGIEQENGSEKNGFHVTLNQRVGNHSASSKIYQDRFKLAHINIIPNDTDLLL